MVWAYVLLILLFVFLYVVSKNFATIKGSYGERKVNKILSKLDPTIYTMYHDLYVPTEKNKTTQVDHVVASPYGIFVIETKHFDGWIFGSEKSRYWTQVIYKRKEKFFNPIWQNAGHVKALQDYLEIDKELFSSIIAFSNQSTFKSKAPFTRAAVIHFPELIRTIKEKQEVQISREALQEVNDKLEDLRITDKKEKKTIKKEHVQAIQADRAKEKAALSDKTTCPKCRSKLVKRNGKHGSFFGCSNFPKCRYTRKVS